MHSGGYEFVGGGTQPAAYGAFFGGGMMQLDSLFSHFAAVVSGFVIGDEIGALVAAGLNTQLPYGGAMGVALRVFALIIVLVLASSPHLALAQPPRPLAEGPLVPRHSDYDSLDITG